MARFVLLIYLYVVFVVFVADAQSSHTKHKSQIKSKGVEQISFKVNQVDSGKVSFTYTIDSKDYALFISNSLTPDKSIVLKEQKLLDIDTLIYSGLKSVPEVGKLVATKFPNLKGAFSIDGLLAQQDYYLHLYKAKTAKSDTFELIKSFEFNTLARKPKFSTVQVAFEDIADTSFSISWLSGDGEGRVVVIAEGDKVDIPQNGKQYKISSIFGKETSRLGKSFVVYDGGNDPRPKIKVPGLKPATKYSVAVFEYNGSGKYRNYNTTPASNNPRTIITKLPTPKITKVVTTSPETYTIKWGKVVGATTYILDVALDEAFQKRVEPFIDLDVGDLGEFELSDLEGNKTYYLRIKAKGPTGESLYSPIFEIKSK